MTADLNTTYTPATVPAATATKMNGNVDMQSAKRAPEVNGHNEPGYKTQRAPTDLVLRFIEQWQELEQYKFVDSCVQ